MESRSLSPSKAVAAVIFLLLIHCANSFRRSSDYYLKQMDQMQDFDHKIESRDYPILKKSNLVVNKGDILEVKIGKLFSNKTKPHDSYYSLPFCRPNNTVDSAAEFESSPYVFKILEPQVCNVVCRITLPDDDAAKKLQEKMDDKYHVNMILGGLPLVMQRSEDYQLGYPVGGNIPMGSQNSITSTTI